jgi:predicted enzyme related to lactoylglutathione lyase
VDDYTDKIAGNGGTLLVPKFAVPGVGYAAYFKDTEGNPFGIFEDDSAAS